MPRDSQRQRLYNAETAICDDGKTCGRRFGTVTEIQAYVDAICSSRWFKARWGNRHITVLPGRGQSKAFGGDNVIKMPVWSRSELIVLHEVAHCLTPDHYATHGREYAAIYLALVRHEIKDGGLTAAMLQESFKAMGVNYRWTIPTNHHVETQKAVAARQQITRTRSFGTAYARTQAAGTLRYLIAQGELGLVGSASRQAALATARVLERGSQ